MASPTDITFRAEQGGKQAISTRLEYVVNIAQRLLHMRPGDDDYDPEMGLNIMKETNVAAEDGSRNTDFEQKALRQFQTYTDIAIQNIIAIYKDHVLRVQITFRFQGEAYAIFSTSDPDSLVSLLPIRN